MHLNGRVARYAVLATRILLHQKQYPAALTLCERALALDAHESEAAALRRRCFEALGISLAELDEEAHDASAAANLPPSYADEDEDEEEEEEEYEGDKEKRDENRRTEQSQVPLLFMLDVPSPVVAGALAAARSLAETGRAPRAACALAVFVLSGSARAPPLPRPAEEAAALYKAVCDAATAGHAPARRLCARMLCYGLCCERNLEKALSFVVAPKSSETAKSKKEQKQEQEQEREFLKEIYEAAEAVEHWEDNRMLGADGLASWERVGRMDAAYVPSARLAQLERLAADYARDAAAGVAKAAQVDATTRAALEAVPRIAALYRAGSRAAGDALAALHLAFDACQCASQGRALEAYARVRRARRVCDGVALPLAPLAAAYEPTAAAHPDAPDVRFFRLLFAAQLAPASRAALAEAAVRAEPCAADARAVHAALLALLGHHARAIAEAAAARRLDPSVAAYAYAEAAARMGDAHTDAQARACVAALEAYLAAAAPDARCVPDAHYNIARLLLGLRAPAPGDAAAARRHYRAAVAAAVQPAPRPFFFPPVAPAPALARIIETLPDDE